ncbi:DUF5954 family protein [Streptomyces sp. NPDC088725]|uniref:DUF5954 family protein n=1 Tax=Streptomyces sp. NPDC088725 TaxID=3365873 RepID=UPI00380A3DDC
MSEHGENVPAYQKVRVGPQDSPAAAIADVDAWQARDQYPHLLGGGGPVFGVAQELDTGGWEILSFGEVYPQTARDSMSMVFRQRASEAEKDGNADARAELMEAAERLDWEVLDDLTVCGIRYRIVRAEPFIRMGPTGPEPPRPSDPDPAEVGEAYRLPLPTKGFVIDTFAESGMSEAILRVELLTLVRKPGTVPDDVWEDSQVAVRTHPGGVLLPAEFMTAEYVNGDWRPTAATSGTPQGARDVLGTYLRVMAPVVERLDKEQRAVYAAAADKLDAERSDEIEVAGCLSRVVRVERLVRIGPDGPEGPRPSDHDPEPPPSVHVEQLRAQGVILDENEPLVLSEETKELSRLYYEEEERRKALREARGAARSAADDRDENRP